MESMILFILSLFTAISFGATPPGCDELGKILQDYELDLQKSSIKDCTPELAGTLLNTLKTTPLAQNVNYLKDRVCLDLMTVESELEKLKLELAVLNGIDKLKETVSRTHQEVKNDKTKDIQTSVRGFTDSLNTAQSLELLLNSTVEDKTTKEVKPFLAALKDFPESQRLNLLDFKNRIQELCAGKSKKEPDACNSKEFDPGKEASQEILALINNTKPDLKQISKWQEQLKIKRKNSKEGDKEYSFIEMQRELKDAFTNIDSKTVLTKEQIKFIQKLDEFTFDPKFSFVTEIANLKDKKKNKIASDKFFLLMEDVKRRQEYEVQSKLSIAWENLKRENPASHSNPKEKNVIDSLTDIQKKNCEMAKSTYDAAVECKKSLEGIATNNVILTNFLSTIETSKNYRNSLDEQIKFCTVELKTKEEPSEECFACLSGNKADVDDKINQLNMVKEKIGSENVRNMQFRNFALKKWTDQKCQTKDASLDMCETPGLLSKDALMTANDAMKISIVYNSSEEKKSEAEKKAKILCEDVNGKELTRIETQICKFFNDTTPNTIDPVNPDESYEAPTDAPRDGLQARIRGAWVDGTVNLFNGILPLVYQNQFNQSNQFPMGVNPYPYNYTPYNFNSASPQMGFADTLMFNARYYGSYGFYMPTPGYQPYTAFGANSPLSSYTPMSTVTPTKYFSF